MTLISIPFSPEMAAATLNGMKCCTSRSQLYGRAGDLFAVDGALFRRLDTHLHSMNSVRNCLYRLEGFPSPDAFEHTWRQLHKSEFNPVSVYYIHYFARADGGDDSISNPVTGASYPVRYPSSRGGLK